MRPFPTAAQYGSVVALVHAHTHTHTLTAWCTLTARDGDGDGDTLANPAAERWQQTPRHTDGG